MPNYKPLIKIAFLIVFSLEIIVLAVLFMYIAWQLTISTTEIFRGVALILGGAIGFTLGSIIFWRFSAKFSVQRRFSKT